jgi:hypothetical protein
MQRFLIAVFFIAPLSASTIIMVTCQAGGTNVSQSDPASAQCSATDPPRADTANTNGTVTVGAISGFTDVESFNNAVATVDASFDFAFTSTTTITWNVTPFVSGPFGYAQLNLGGLIETYCEHEESCNEGPDIITQTLGPGAYTFSAYAQVSDEGSARFTLDSSIIPSPSAPEPGTLALVALALVLPKCRAMMLRIRNR